MALRSDADGFLIGDPLDMGPTLDLWRDVRDDMRAILGMLRKRQGEAQPAPETRSRDVQRPAIVLGRRVDRPVRSTGAAAPVARPGRAEFARQGPSPADTPRRTVGAGVEAQQTNTLLGRVIRRIDGHEQRLTKSLKAIERAIKDLTEVARQSSARAAGEVDSLSGWLGGAGAAIAGWMGLKKGGSLLKNLSGGAKNLLSKILAGRMGGPLGAILGGVGLVSAWTSADADEQLTDRERAAKKGTAVGQFVGLMGGAAAGATAGSLLGPVGTLVGGLIGGALGSWGGGKAGEVITEQAVDFADTETGMRIAQQWASTTAALRGRWDTLVTRGTETFSGMGAQWNSAVDQIQGWFAEASGALSRLAEQANTWIKDKTGIDIKAEAQNAAEAITDGAARANTWVKDKTGVDVGESVKRGIDAATEAVRSGFDRLINLLHPGSPDIVIDGDKLTADLGSGGALRHAATASITAGAVSDVPTLSQATEASALASVGSSPGTGLVTTTSVGQGEKALLERIAHGEGTSDAKARAHGFESGYDVSYAFGKYSPKGGKRLSEMTLGEVKQYQEQMLANQSGNKIKSTAVGKYQIIRKTLDALQKKLGLSDDTVFSPEVQDQMGMELLKTRGYDQWKAGKKSDRDFQKALSQEWASIADPDTGRSYYGQHVGTTDAEIKQAMAAAKSGAPATASGPVINDAALKADLSIGGSLWKTASANATAADAQSDVKTLTQATEASALATPASAGQATQSVVRRINQKSIRNKDITPELEAKVHEAVRAVYGDGARADLYSGGQDKKGQGTRRTGSTRHDDGKAGDFYIYGADGKQIKGDELGKLGQYWTAKGYGGVGMEMSGGGIHLDVHTDRPRAWGYEKHGGRYTKAQREAIARGLRGELPELKLDPAIAALPGKVTSATTAPDQAVAQASAPSEKTLTAPDQAVAPADQTAREVAAPSSSKKPLDPFSNSLATMMIKIPGMSDSWRKAASARAPVVTPSSWAMDTLISTGSNAIQAAIGALTQGPRGLPRRPPPNPRDALKGIARAAAPNPAGMFGQVAHGVMGALAMMPQQSLGALSVAPPVPSIPIAMPIPRPAAAPSVPEPVTSPRSQWAGDRKDDNRLMRNVGQDVRDRRIAHIVTGGIGAAL